MDTTPYQKPPRLSIALTPAALAACVSYIIRSRPDIRVWLFRGALGSGKTTSIRGVLRAMGAKGRIMSPTYTLARVYQLRGGISALHVDAYRVKDSAEWAALEINEFQQSPTSYLLVEWPDRLAGFEWGTHGEISLQIIPRGRKVTWRVITPLAGVAVRRTAGRRRRHLRSSRQRQS